jgi:hypothetical protein
MFADALEGKGNWDLFILPDPSVLRRNLMLCTWVVMTATRWRDGTTGQHVDYDQRPDVFR